MSQFAIVNIHKLMQKDDAATSGTRYEFIKSCSLRFHRFMNITVSARDFPQSKRLIINLRNIFHCKQFQRKKIETF